MIQGHAGRVGTGRGLVIDKVTKREAGFGRFWSGVVSGSHPAPSVFDVWVMRDDDPPGVWLGGGGIG